MKWLSETEQMNKKENELKEKNREWTEKNLVFATCQSNDFKIKSKITGINLAWI